MTFIAGISAEEIKRTIYRVMTVIVVVQIKDSEGVLVIESYETFPYLVLSLRLSAFPGRQLPSYLQDDC